MNLDFFQIDAFANAPFTGNPAAVCLLDDWIPDVQLQAIAMENNLSETAFVVGAAKGKAAGGAGPELRWFTPTDEVDLCGHATLAAAHALWLNQWPADESIAFATREAGTLTVTQQKGMIWLDFPSRPPALCVPRQSDASTSPEVVTDALGLDGPQAIASIHAARDLIIELHDAAQVRDLQPKMAAIAELETFAVCVTAAGDPRVTGDSEASGGADFCSRFFAPRKGVPEDPVTGSAHCSLAPFWAERLGKDELLGYQASARGGEVRCRVDSSRGRVHLGGAARCVITGTFHV